MSASEFVAVANRFNFRGERTRLIAYEALVNGASYGDVAKKWDVSRQAVSRMVVRFVRERQRADLANTLCQKYGMDQEQSEEIISLVLVTLRMTSG